MYFSAFKHRSVDSYIGYTLHAFCNEDDYEMDETRVIAGNSTASASLFLDERYGPTCSEDDNGAILEYLYTFGYQLNVPETLVGGRYATTVQLEVSTND